MQAGEVASRRIQYLDNSRSCRAGLRVWDRPADTAFSDFLDLGLARMEAKEQAARDSLRAKMQAARDRGDLGTERLFVGGVEGDILTLAHGGPGMHARMTYDLSTPGIMKGMMEMSPDGTEWKILFEAVYKRT